MYLVFTGSCDYGINYVECRYNTRAARGRYLLWYNITEKNHRPKRENNMEYDELINIPNDNNVGVIFYCDYKEVNRANLLECALNSAKSGKVLYIVQKELEVLPEKFQSLNSVNRLYMKMINFLYTKDIKSLIENISTLPSWQSVPSTVILDGLDEYCTKEQLQQACGLVAYLIDTVSSCSHNVSSSKCNLFISINRHTVGDGYCDIIEKLYKNVDK